uniref:Putative tail protein n=2 Tax=viral metagenome TaxID=1070528 RepID=A0A6M3JD48_9ZZZZ
MDDATQGTARTTLGVGTGDSPTWAGATLTSVLGLSANSAVFQPAADSTTFFQVLDADGGTPIFNIDSTNESVQIGTSTHVNTFALIIAGGNILLDNARAMNIKDFGGTPRRVYSLATTNRSYIGPVDAGWGEWTFITAGTSMRFRVNSASGAFTNAMDINAATGFIHIPAGTAETLLELTHATPYITLHNDTHEDTDGGRESRLIFKGEQSGGEETTLARIEASHDGSADTEHGQLVGYTNDGADGDTPTEGMRLSRAGISTANDPNTLGVGVTTFIVESNVMTMTGDGAGNTIATITGAKSGTLLTLIFVDALVTITDTDAHTANTVDLAGTATNFTSADDKTLQIVFDGTSWYETSRGTN